MARALDDAGRPPACEQQGRSPGYQQQLGPLHLPVRGFLPPGPLRSLRLLDTTWMPLSGCLLPDAYFFTFLSLSAGHAPWADPLWLLSSLPLYAPACLCWHACVCEISVCPHVRVFLLVLVPPLRRSLKPPCHHRVVPPSFSFFFPLFPPFPPMPPFLRHSC